MRRLVVAILLSLLASSPASALDIPIDSFPIHVELPRDLKITSGTVIFAEGSIEADGPITLVLRIDDDWSESYATRVNQERVVPPGPFRWELPLRGLKTSGGRTLRPDTLRRIHLFNASDKGKVAVTAFRLIEGTALPPGTAGFSLGAADAPLFGGFERIAPGDFRLTTTNALPIRRPGVDPLIASGMRNVERLQLPWPPGRTAVTLWVEDVGEWETLPYAMRRRIRVNGVDALDETLTPQQWIERRYLRGQDVEYRSGADSWETYGSRRGGQITVEVDVAMNGIVIELAGDSPTATYLSAVLLEPAGSTIARDLLTRQRREWFVNAWPVAAAATPEKGGAGGIALPLPAGASAPLLELTTAAGTGSRLQVEVTQHDAGLTVPVELKIDGEARRYFTISRWVAQKRLDRDSTGGNLLRPNDSLLRAETHPLLSQAGETRRHVLWIAASAATPPGVYTGVLKTASALPDDGLRVRITVPDVRLPQPAKAAGYYLEEPAHLGWFAETAALGLRQLGCDMAFLSGLGITGNAPPIPSPFANQESAAIDLSRQASQYATTSPWLAYSAAKRLREKLGPEGSARQIEGFQARLKAAGIPAPVWSVADEPSNPDQGGEGLKKWIAMLRQIAPDARLAGHLNAVDDFSLLSLFDVVLVNQGYGLDLARLRKTAGTGREIWLYNTGKSRFSAGIWLWRTPATRYLQWHARMPTADPFDPTDGREGDVQIFPPTREICAPTPDIDEGVLDMAEGLIDQRWLAWLEKEPRGASLLRAIRTRIGDEWQTASTLTEHDLDGIREDIQTVARTLK
jgi:hypothetical protein